MLLVAVWAFAEAMLFFIVADVPISAIGFRYGFRRAAAAALVAALAAGGGGLIVKVWASADPEAYRTVLEHIPGISPGLISRAVSAYAGDPAGAMLLGSFKGIPYKLYAYAAGLSGATVLPFFAASIGARLPRFLLVATLSAAVGSALRDRLTAFRIRLLFLAFWVLFYAVYFTLMAAHG